eukprot:275766_1
METEEKLSYGMDSLSDELNFSNNLTEERTIMVYHPHAISFTEYITSRGSSVIIISEIIEPTNIEFSTKFRSSVDVSRLVSCGDLVCKINNKYIEPNTSFYRFENILNSEFKRGGTNKPVSITIIKRSSLPKYGKLNKATTVLNALKWKSEQEERYSHPRNKLKRTLDSIYIQLFIFILIIIDLTIFTISEITNNNNNDVLWKRNILIITFVILLIY